MISTVIFDIGNVLADFSWEPFYRSFGFSEQIFERLSKATVKSPQWNELDRGAWTTEEILQSFIQNDPGIEQEIRHVFHNVGAMVTRREYAIKWVRHLKEQGYRVLYLSNFGEITRAHCQDALSFMPYMDGGIMSYEVKLIKPEAAIYQALVDKYDLIPEECVFIDDLDSNIRAAQALGFHTVHATSHEAALCGLEAIGISRYKEGRTDMYTRNKDIAVTELGGGVSRKILSHAPNLMTVELHFDKGAVGAPHSHPHEQIGYIIKGRLEYTEAGETTILQTGDTYYVAPDVVHGVVALEDTWLLDIFTPEREDFLK